MAEELSNSNNNENEMLELSICQPDHPNQAVFISNREISLDDFRIKLSESALSLPEEWVFMTAAGSLVSTAQEANLHLSSITRERGELEMNENVLNVMVAPAVSYQRGFRGAPPPAGSPLASFATIVGALRDIYVTSIQPNLHDLIKPLIIAAAVSALLTFVLALILSMSLGALGGINRSLLMPFFQNHFCGEGGQTGAQISELYERIGDLEKRMMNMRQVEVGSLTCKQDRHMYEELDSHVLYVPFRKTRFSDAPRVIFGLHGLSVDDLSSVRLDQVKVNATGFSLRCSYAGKWMHYEVEYSWVAVGK